MLKDLVKTCRSYRRFFVDVPNPMDDLRDMVDTARLTASADPALHEKALDVLEGIHVTVTGREG